LYPTPVSINYLYSFGFLSACCLGIQVISGVLLSMHYTPYIQFAFFSVEQIMRDVNFGWLFRYIHSNFASIFFGVVYIHILKNLYYNSYMYPRILVWQTGIIMYLCMMLIAFTGYVLPWGQMSFWAAMVITNLFTTIPIVGNDIAMWLWGGFSIDNPTLNRFFSLHFVFPFLLVGFVIVHLLILHVSGSSNKLRMYKNMDNISFYPYFYIKDVFFLLNCIFGGVLLIYFYPNLFMHVDNYDVANPLVTPAHLVPEWYFLPYYAMLRAVPNKLGGLVVMILPILLLVFVSYDVCTYSKNTVILDGVVLFLLGVYGGKPIEVPYLELSQILTIIYLIRPFIGFSIK